MHKIYFLLILILPIASSVQLTAGEYTDYVWADAYQEPQRPPDKLNISDENERWLALQTMRGDAFY